MDGAGIGQTLMNNVDDVFNASIGVRVRVSALVTVRVRVGVKHRVRVPNLTLSADSIHWTSQRSIFEARPWPY